ncbi:MAG: DUF4041 domain-containing protein [Clostridiales bacterium]|nr:DUF4041 domain-containing protein [Clostridiales bacterium]
MNQDKNTSVWPKVGKIIANIVLAVLNLIWLFVAIPVGIVGFIAQVALNYTSGRSKKTEAEIQALKDEVESLSRFREISDVDAEATHIKENAKVQSEHLLAEAQSQAAQIRDTASADAEKIRADAQSQVSAAREKNAAAEVEASKKIESAVVESKRIVAEAEEKAKEIAGDAYLVSKNVEELRQTETALRNAINGYGDEWLKPTYSLLDELADEFSYADAGQKLRDARDHSATMVKAGVAAACDYVETTRRETAIRFVIDAFNGKVDSILSKTKKDNYGKLERAIRDAYFMVNMNGQAFRNARITPEYLDARLQELKWAVVAMELRAKELEEQRRIREQMREESRARREYERAQRDAAKEEAILKRAMEKAQRMFEKASEDQKSQFKAQLDELEAKLREAEEKGQRALSMAQQTKHGNVYVISNVGSFGENVYKVGMTRRLEPMDRVRELGDASVPFAFDVHAIIESDDAPALEHKLHQELAMMQVNKVNPRKEFFRVSLSDIRALVEKQGLSAKWTMTAEAAEYHETLAIEERMKTDPDAQRQWAAFYERLQESSVDDEDELISNEEVTTA